MSRLYRALLFAYPAGFRARFGRAMLTAFEDELAELRGHGGLGAVVRKLWDTVRDALSTAFAMRWARWRGRPGAPLSRREAASRWYGQAPDPGDPGIGHPDSGTPGREPGFIRRAIVDPLLVDLRFAVRGLRRSPGFAVVAIGTLAIAVGATTTVFSVVDGLLLRRPPLLEPDRLVTLTEQTASANGGFTPFAISPANLVDWRERNTVFSGIAATLMASATLGEGEQALELQGLRVSANFFNILGVPAALGRTFVPDEDPPDSPAVVVISHGLWQRAFAGDPSVVGREVRLSGARHTIIGVLPPDFSFVSTTGPNVDTLQRDYWMPDPFGRRGAGERRFKVLGAVARLAPGVDIEQAREEMRSIAAALADEYPDANRNALTGAANSVSLSNYQHFLVRNIRPALWMLLGAVGFVLAIACANIANLLLVRATARRGEIAVRRALGAGRLRLARQLLTESAVLAGLGGAGGLVLAWFAVPGLVSLAPVTIPPSLLDNITIGGRVVAFAVLTCLAALCMFGVAPVLHFASQSGLTLRSVSEAGARRQRASGRQLVATTQLALALTLLVGMGLLVVTFTRLHALPLGFDPDGVITANTSAPRAARNANDTADTPGDTTRAIVERLASQREIVTAGAVGMLPLWGNANKPDLRIEGRPAGVPGPDGAAPTVDPSGVPDRALLRVVTPGYFDTLRMPLLQGRDLTWSDDAAAPHVAVINEAMAEAYFAGQSPLGRLVTIIGRRAPGGAPLAPVEIVGVVGKTWELSHYLFAGKDPGTGFVPTIYIPARPNTFVARLAGDVPANPDVMRTIINEIDPQRRIASVDTLTSYVDQMLISGELRLSAVVIGALAVVALLLALTGVYGTMAFLVACRTREIGIRMALGARGDALVRALVAQGLRIAVLGTLVGLLIAAGTTHVLSNWLYGVSPTDPITFASLSFVIILAATMACWIPARRAARVDPVASLRAEP